ncbi:Ectonucleoside triphosphate diphosphohydrolase 5 [Rhynchospora pubera]|uniref:Ectonucleoside triphosphate diphosphohydrolase 5 n=1 Tax=Rhynchospora pubera TaxID=906938 RepID=A0AAV8G0E9_9POAL|nr:Ectonucleoside triphosphate diphosphohydrolase 5 [Rhynchospora pubera]
MDIYRFCKVVTIVSVILLFVSVALLFLFELPSDIATAKTKNVPEESTNWKNMSEERTNWEDKYAVVFDMASSANRLHVYRFGENLKVLHMGEAIELFVQQKPGLSALAGHPKKAAKSLIPLLEKAKTVIPPKLWKKTPVIVGATAGLETVGINAAEKILQVVRHMLEKRSSLLSHSEWTSLVNRTQEGAFQWVTINYLFGKLGQTHADTVGVLDLGDSSVVMAYAISEGDATKAPKVSEREESSVQNLLINATSYDIYVHSYLHYGLLAARAEILKVGNNCMLSGYKGTYRYGNKKYNASATSSGTNYTKCKTDVVKGLNFSKPACTRTKCTNWHKNLFLTSLFFDKAYETGFVDPKTGGVAKVKASDFEDAAKHACSLNMKYAEKEYPSLSYDSLSFLCMDLVYQFILLRDGYGKFIHHCIYKQKGSIYYLELTLDFLFLCRCGSLSRDEFGEKGAIQRFLCRGSLASWKSNSRLVAFKMR